MSIEPQLGTDFSTAFWDLIFSATGLHGPEIDGLRQLESDSTRTIEVCEETNRDFSWTDTKVIRTIRDDLQQYIETLTHLKAENAFRAANKRPKSFVDEKKYQALRSREATQRLTCSHIVQRICRLNLQSRDLTSLTSELCLFENVTDLNLCGNPKLTVLDFLPPNVRGVFASGCNVTSVSEGCMQGTPKLLFLSVSVNKIEDLTFLAFTRSLAAVDLSYNEVSSFTHVVDTFQGHPTITDVSLIGNPVSLLPNYRQRLASSCPKLARIDDRVVTQEERTWFAPGFKLKEDAVPLRVQIATIKGVTGLLPPEEVQRIASAGKSRSAPKDAKKAKAGAEEEKKDAAQRRTMFSLVGSWPGITNFKTDLIDAVPVAVEEVVQKSGPKGAAAGKKAAAVAVDAPPPDEVAVKYEITTDLQIDRESVAKLSRPLEIDLVIHDHVTAPGSSDGPKVNSFVLGRFIVDHRQIAAQGISASEGVQLRMDDNSKAIIARRIRKMSEHLTSMQAEDRNLDVAMHDEIHKFQTTPPPDAPVAAAAAAAAPKGKGAEKGKPQAAKVLNEGLIVLQTESAQRKALIDELTAQLSFEEKRAAKLRSAALTLTGAAAIGAAIVIAVPVTIAQSPAPTGKK